ncbi:hypothetical protein [Paenibacillus beijingensis]|uniref:hypothetical protein n=1 Tax=Paenibacillus beijingensis TaxID=1126833 RepID=UPI0006969A55|nr:hypothetical protein [Paenibacillus beijingensis]
MWVILAGVLGCYALVAAAVHLTCKISERRPRQADKHYVFVTKNNQSRLEGDVRKLQLFSFFMGTNMNITVVDLGSVDDTAAIASRLGDGVKLFTDYEPVENLFTEEKDNPQVGKEPFQSAAGADDAAAHSAQPDPADTDPAQPNPADAGQAQTDPGSDPGPHFSLHGLLERFGIGAEHAVIIDLQEPDSRG